jgi:hypothetical protein
MIMDDEYKKDKKGYDSRVGCPTKYVLFSL